MAAKKGATPVTEKVFKAAKILLESGASNKEVAEYLDISATTVSRIRNAETYEEYKNILNAWQRARAAAFREKNAKNEEKANYASPQAQVVEHRQSVTIQATHYMMTEMQKTNELLTAISAKLAFIVDELCGTARKES